MQLSDLTPMILTFNESANLRRTLASVSWASQILIVDSFSTDETLAIVAEYPQATVVQRVFDHFADQCNYGLKHITTPWVLSMDADYVCSPELPQEIEALDGSAAGYQVSFIYSIYGRDLRSCLYPPRTVLYQRDKANYLRDGHAHRVKIEGDVAPLKAKIVHDDRKPLSHWLRSQLKYAAHEAEKLTACSLEELGWKDRLRRKIVWAPLLTPVYCLFAKRLILDGWPGIFYAIQRTFAELVLSLTLLDRKLVGEEKRSPSPPAPLPESGLGGIEKN